MRVRIKKADNVFAAVESLNVNKGDVVIFYIRTDSEGNPVYNIETVYENWKTIEETINKKCQPAAILCLMDKIELGNVMDCDMAISRLEEYIQKLEIIKARLAEDENDTAALDVNLKDIEVHEQEKEKKKIEMRMNDAIEYGEDE